MCRIDPSEASVFPQEGEFRVTDEHRVRSAFSSDRLEVFVDQEALRL